MDNEPFAKAGDWVTAEDGTRVCRLKVNLYCGKSSSPSDFEEWQFPIPVSGDPIDKTPGFRSDGRVCQMHIDGKWVPPIPSKNWA